MRLILISGTHGYEGAIYRTEIESFTQITAHGSAGNGPAWFEAKTKDGRTIEYGNSSFSRVEPIGSATPYCWKVNKITDRNGNYILYNYNEESGESTISTIEYSGNSIGGITPYNMIIFKRVVRLRNKYKS